MKWLRFFLLIFPCFVFASSPQEQIDSLNVLLSKAEIESEIIELKRMLLNTHYSHSMSFSEAHLQYIEDIKAYGKKEQLDSMYLIGLGYDLRNKLRLSPSLDSSVIKEMTLLKNKTKKLSIYSTYYSLMAECSQHVNDPIETLRNIRLSLHYSSVVKEPKRFTHGYSWIAGIKIYFAENDSGLYFAQKALDVANEFHLKEKLPKLHYMVGSAYGFLGDKQKEMFHMMQADSIGRTIDEFIFRALAVKNLGLYFFNSGDPKNGIDLLEKSIKISRDNNSYRSLAQTLHITGRKYLEIDSVSLAEAYINEGLSLIKNRALGNYYVFYPSLGEVKFKQKKYEAAYKIYSEAIRNDNSGKGGNRISNGLRLISCFEVLNMPDSVVLYGNQFLLDKAYQNQEYIAEIYLAVSNAYEAMGQLDLAFENHKKYASKRDSFQNLHFDQQVTQTREQFLTNEKEREIEALNKSAEIASLKAQRQDFAIYALTGGVILFIVIFFLVYKRKQRDLVFARQAALLEKQQQEIETQRSLQYRLKALRAQLNPHFIFNALTSIQNYILKNDVEESNKYLGSFSRLMRNTLDNSEEDFITLEEEIQVLTDYALIENLRIKGGFEFEIKVEEALKFEAYVPTMLIQPYVENAIWHGVSKKLGDKKILVSFDKKDDLLVCSIEDNGVGRGVVDKTKTRKSHSMRINKDRLNLLNSVEGDIASVEVIDKVDEHNNSIGTKVIIVFPFELI